MGTTSGVTGTADDGRYLTLAELAGFVDAARQAGVPDTARLAVRTRNEGFKGPRLREITTVEPASTS